MNGACQPIRSTTGGNLFCLMAAASEKGEPMRFSVLDNTQSRLPNDRSRYRRILRWAMGLAVI